jgi:DNA invertase Pin-like site-specific DNA recombinase
MSQPGISSPIRAAQYVRMSTEHQRYSIDNQKAAIGEYALARGYEIVASYADGGKSGLSLKGRNALKQLLSDALAPGRTFEAILILDISRWGRFQDPDQAGHYEYICRQAGVRLIYCGEPFENDLSAASSILKQLKRVMAAEYSRELSDKLARAHRQQASLGFRQGGILIYGFRRELRDRDGTVRGLLEPGQYKMLSTDKVVIVPGPPEELAVIRRIFDLFVRRKLSLKEIARTLRSEGIPSKDGAPWTAPRVNNVLKSDYCIGISSYNRTRKRLQGPVIDNPESEWTRTETMVPTVPLKLFRKAQERLAQRRDTRYGTRYMLDALRRLLKKEGRLSSHLLGPASGTPSDAAYRAHFGSVYEAFRRAGYEPPVWQARLGRGESWTPDTIREALRTACARYGYVTRMVIDQDPGLPSSAVVRRHFGTLVKAYKEAGLPVMTRGEIQKAAYLRQRAREVSRPGGGRFRSDGALLKPHYSTDQIVERLKQILDQQGYLSCDLLRNDPELPSPPTIGKRFGSVFAAYALAGWLGERKRTPRRVRKNGNSPDMSKTEPATVVSEDRG